TLHGLVVTLNDFHLSMFPTGTTPAVNWSPNPEDCDTPSDGCGSVFVNTNNSCEFQDCRLTGLYSHSGVFDATVRIHLVTYYPTYSEQIFKDYPVAIEAVNQYPVPR